MYDLLEKDSFSVKYFDHIMFTLLSEYPGGAATIVHMLSNASSFSYANMEL